MLSLESPVSEFIQNSHLELVNEDASVAEAAEILRHNNIGCVLVEGEGVLKGIFTERDFMKRVVATRLPLDKTRISDVMTSNPEALLALDEVAWAINKMAIGGFRNIPVVDSSGRPVGVVSVFDVIDLLDGALADALSANDSDEDGDDEHWHDLGGG